MDELGVDACFRRLRLGVPRVDLIKLSIVLSSEDLLEEEAEVGRGFRESF